MRWKYETKKSQLPQFYTHSLPMDDHVDVQTVPKQIAGISGIISSEEAEIETRYILNTQTSSL